MGVTSRNSVTCPIHWLPISVPVRISKNRCTSTFPLHGEDANVTTRLAAKQPVSRRAQKVTDPNSHNLLKHVELTITAMPQESYQQTVVSLRLG